MLITIRPWRRYLVGHVLPTLLLVPIAVACFSGDGSIEQRLIGYIALGLAILAAVTTLRISLRLDSEMVRVYNPFRTRQIRWGSVRQVSVGRTVLPITKWMEYSILIITDSEGRRVRVSASVLLRPEEVRRLLEAFKETQRQHGFGLDVDPAQFPIPRTAVSK